MVHGHSGEHGVPGLGGNTLAMLHPMPSLTTAHLGRMRTSLGEHAASACAPDDSEPFGCVGPGAALNAEDLWNAPIRASSGVLVLVFPVICTPILYHVGKSYGLPSHGNTPRRPGAASR